MLKINQNKIHVKIIISEANSKNKAKPHIKPNKIIFLSFSLLLKNVLKNKYIIKTVKNTAPLYVAASVRVLMVKSCGDKMNSIDARIATFLLKNLFRKQNNIINVPKDVNNHNSLIERPCSPKMENNGIVSKLFTINPPWCGPNKDWYSNKLVFELIIISFAMKPILTSP